jgi:hypothetical protein
MQPTGQAAEPDPEVPADRHAGRSHGPGRRLEQGEISDQRVGSVMVLVT